MLEIKLTIDPNFIPVNLCQETARYFSALSGMGQEQTNDREKKFSETIAVGSNKTVTLVKDGERLCEITPFELEDDSDIPEHEMTSSKFESDKIDEKFSDVEVEVSSSVPGFADDSKTFIVNRTPPAEVDIDGKIWDGKTHSSARTKNQDGRWKMKRNLREIPAPVSGVQENLYPKLTAKITDAILNNRMTYSDMDRILKLNGIKRITDAQGKPELIRALIIEFSKFSEV